MLCDAIFFSYLCTDEYAKTGCLLAVMWLTKGRDGCCGVLAALVFFCEWSCSLAE